MGVEKLAGRDDQLDLAAAAIAFFVIRRGQFIAGNLHEFTYFIAQFLFEVLPCSCGLEGNAALIAFVAISGIPNVGGRGERGQINGELDFCYETGGCGYGIYRQLTRWAIGVWSSRRR